MLAADVYKTRSEETTERVTGCLDRRKKAGRWEGVKERQGEKEGEG